MKGPSSKTKPNAGEPKAPEDAPKKRGRKVVIIEESEEEETPPEKPENLNGPKKTLKNNQKLLERNDDVEDPNPRHKQLPYLGIPDLNSNAKESVEEYDPVPFYEKRPIAYKHLAPIENVKNEEQALSSLLKAPVTLSAEVLMSISPGVRQELFKALAKKKVPIQTAHNRKVTIVEEVDKDAPPIKKQEDNFNFGKININDLDIKATFMCTTEDDGVIPKGSIVLTDPVEQYLQGLGSSETPKEIYVSKESHALKSIYPVINKFGQVESLLDGGSQIVSMDAEVAKKLAVPWDPDITIQMQTANRTVEKTLGLAKNVPFNFGGIMIYLQVHVIRDPAYKVLLGRPFDVLTGSVVVNSTDGGQTVTITDPNSGRRAMLPTFDRGKPPVMMKMHTEEDLQPKTEKVFQPSMI
ncbi:uncharacterized protein LACBIDRAFT_314764 [Laccaria bicolor S238N-H82]|uniref:Predicted protein n=3 Tax=Laccaria bicolor (strain S238N-H82 / ATCC MYA-4686) TaxID=486041 RepID=B0DZ66_LACBS|nr:uncharacterized protein LACBIDRAFT_314764 [Laccaria bicolor S238N-H82]EDR00182.1 predicted protein [Laccaria bicolor S238N-H82]|eukprot:XP_001889239.1 predicted protein [Laccaria bicolor S238N-H82]